MSLEGPRQHATDTAPAPTPSTAPQARPTPPQPPQCPISVATLPRHVLPPGGQAGLRPARLGPARWGEEGSGRVGSGPAPLPRGRAGAGTGAETLRASGAHGDAGPTRPLRACARHAPPTPRAARTGAGRRENRVT